ncbi:hypothetical protein [Nocardia cyriacigeorgica]|uniref:hypothetical protein n=1 Tax=Nocardia cyriacigeorgica TaxID=135487 RepID=UPI0011089EFD|nr:hypothetical protein [Nocardia cyriacigeorgica]
MYMIVYMWIGSAHSRCELTARCSDSRRLRKFRGVSLIDGNKRTAWIAADIMLVMNQGSGLQVDPERQEEFMNLIAEGKMEVAEIATQLKRWV